MKSKYFVLGFLTACIVSLCLVTPFVSSFTRTENRVGAEIFYPRRLYGEINIQHAGWLSQFVQDYDLARVEQAEWVKNPITVGMRIAGYPNVDDLNPDVVSTYYGRGDQATVIIYDGGLMDDSIEAEEYRVELERSEGIWEITWVGSRYRCYRSLLPGWSTSSCP